MKYQKDRSKKIGISDKESISDLEISILKVVWSSHETTVREVHESILRQDIKNGRKDFIPYTTVMSTMNGMAEKGLLDVDKSHKVYYYTANIDSQELSRSLIRKIAEKILGKSAKPLVSKFLAKTRQINPEIIESLLEEIDEL